VRQVIDHLADAQMNALIRKKLVLTEKHPTLKPWDQDTWARMARVLEAAPEAGEQTLDSLVEACSGHGLHHVEQIGRPVRRPVSRT
jgi:hypothetical protein